MKNTIEINAQNPNKSVEGSQSIMLDVIESFTKIRANNEIITNISITINTVESGELPPELVSSIMPELKVDKEITPHDHLIDYLSKHVSDEDHGYDISFWFEVSGLYQMADGFDTIDEHNVIAIDYINYYLRKSKSNYRICWKDDFTKDQNNPIKTFWVVEL